MSTTTTKPVNGAFWTRATHTDTHGRGVVWAIDHGYGGYATTTMIDTEHHDLRYHSDRTDACTDAANR